MNYTSCRENITFSPLKLRGLVKLTDNHLTAPPAKKGISKIETPDICSSSSALEMTATILRGVNEAMN